MRLCTLISTKSGSMSLNTVLPCYMGTQSILVELFAIKHIKILIAM